MIKLLRKAFYTTLVFIILVLCLLSFFLVSTPGLYTAIKIAKAYVPGTLKVRQLNGSVLKNFSIGEAEYHYKLISLKASGLKIRWDFKSLLHHQLPIKTITADSVIIETPHSKKILHQLRLKGMIYPDFIKIESLAFSHADHEFLAHLFVNSQFPHTSSGALKITSLEMQKGITALIDFGGNFNLMHWTGEFSGIAKGSITGTLKEASILDQLIKWRELHWQKNPDFSINSPEGRMTVSGTLPQLQATLAAKLNNQAEQNWQLLAHCQGTLPWKWNWDAHLSRPVDSSKQEGLYTQIIAKGSILDSNQATVSLELNPGRYHLPKDSMIPFIAFKQGHINAVLNTTHLSGSGVLTLDDSTKLKAEFNLPHFSLSKGFYKEQSFFGDLSLALNSLDFIQHLEPAISNPKGQLNAHIKVSGTLGTPVLESQLSLNKVFLSVPRLGLNLESIDLNVLSKNKKWEASGSLGSGGKRLFLKGQGPITSEFTGNISLEGSEVPIINTREYQISISPQLNLAFTASQIAISGTILVPYAQIKPQSFTNSVTLSEDVVYANKEEEQAPSPFNTHMDIQVAMGKQVELTYKGLHATLDGNVAITQQPHGPINATGELSVQKGEYKAYGQDLAIEQGQLVFTGGKLNNPGVNLRASKTISNQSASGGSNQLFDFNTNNIQNPTVGDSITVGVEVTGRLTAPKVQLFSNPSVLSQADILSMLVLGRPASQANKAGGQLLLAAISSMNLGGSSSSAQLLEQLKQSLGFDFNVQTNTNYNQSTNQFSDSTAVVVGKSLSKRLYLSYNVGLSQADPNVMTLKYLLNKFLSIQISSSTTANGIDFLYTSSSKEKLHD